MRALRIITAVLAGLSLTMTAAHVLEMPRKLGLPLDLYGRINGALYRYFAVIGGPLQILAIAATATLAWRARHQRTALVAAIATGLAFVSWLTIVQPVNAAISDGTAWSEQLRMRWEVGHAVGFALSLAGFVALLAAVVRVEPVDSTSRSA
jgi:hypothetical protein